MFTLSKLNQEDEKNIVIGKNQLTYPSSTLDPPFTVLDRAKEIEQADSLLKSHVNAKLDVIIEQIHRLQEDARKILSSAERDMELHRVKCNIKKTPGMKLCLYEKTSGEKYFSMLSPAEWGSPPHTYLGCYEVGIDQSFKEVENDS